MFVCLCVGIKPKKLHSASCNEKISWYCLRAEILTWGFPCFINPRVRKIRNEASSCPGIFSRTLRVYYVASSPGSPLTHLLDRHRKLVGCSAIPARSCKNLKKRFEHIEFPAKLLDYFLGRNKGQTYPDFFPASRLRFG